MRVKRAALLGGLWLGLTLIIAALDKAFSEDCPPGAKACKVLTLTPEEETSLIGINMMLDSAVFANRIQMEGVAKYWRDKVQNAHQGVVKEPETKPEIPKK